jgi:hypothetical protein
LACAEVAEPLDRLLRAALRREERSALQTGNFSMVHHVAQKPILQEGEANGQINR